MDPNLKIRALVYFNNFINFLTSQLRYTVGA
jgi:hypothetical protein